MANQDAAFLFELEEIIGNEKQPCLKARTLRIYLRKVSIKS